MTTQQEENLINLLDGYVEKGGHHLNVNVFGTEKLIDAMEHPEKEEYANSILNVVEEFLNEKECEIPWQQSDGDCKVKKQELIKRLRKFL